VTAFLNNLAIERNVAASTQNQALSALLFLYQQVMGHKLPWLDDMTRAKRPVRLPTVLNEAESRGVKSPLDPIEQPSAAYRVAKNRNGALTPASRPTP
jgi:hypothetical protein